MVRVIIVSFLLFFIGSVKGQFLQENHIINSSGVQTTVGQFVVVSSLGESVAGNNTLAGSGFLYRADTTWLNVDPGPVISSFVLNAFPNPTSDWITLTSSSEFLQVEIFNSSGQRIRSQSVIGKSCTIDVQHLSSGNYFLRVKFSDAGYSLVHLLVTNG